MGLSANAEKSGSCGPNLKWHLTDDGVLTITGKGEMYDYSYTPWSNDDLTRVIIGNGVTTIGEAAFGTCTNITQISSEAVVPPTCESGVFTDINKSKCKLIVPKNSLDAYKQAYQWEDFSLIEGSTTGITNTVYNKAGLADVYTIDGTKRLSKASTDEINALPKGVYIVNGKKIIIK